MELKEQRWLNEILKILHPSRAAMLFVFGMVLLDIFGLSLLLSSLPGRQRAFTHLPEQAQVQIALFVFQYLCSVYFISLVLSWIERTLRPKSTLSFYLSFLIYSFIYLSVIHPQIFDDLRLNALLPNDRSLWNIQLVYLISALLLFQMAVNSQALQERNPKSLIGFFLCAMLLIANISNLSLGHAREHVQADSAASTKVTRTIAPLRKPELPHIIVVMVDGLPANRENLLRDFGNSSLHWFLDKSSSYRRLFSPIPQTHGSIFSLLSGKSPQESGVRHAFHESSLHMDQVHFENLGELKKRGYTVSFLSDSHDTSTFDRGPSIDRVDTPRPSFTNSFVSKIFYSKIFHAFLNNFAGSLFFPNLFENGSWPFTYDARAVADSLIERVDRTLSAVDGPQFIVVHICAYHIPAILPYPYYPKIGLENAVTAKFSFSFGFIPALSGPRSSRERKLKNYEVFQNGIKFVTVEILNPLFNYLERKDYLRSSNVILMSDHGENLWESPFVFPRPAEPFHGDTLLFATNSEEAFFKARLLNSERAPGPKDMVMKDVIPDLFFDGPIEPPQFHVVETGTSPFREFEGQLKTLAMVGMEAFFDVEERSGIAFLRPGYLRPLMIEKQKAVLNHRFRFTLYPTLYGRKLFLCDRKFDPHCILNSRQRDVRQEMFEVLQSYIKADEAKHLDSAIGSADDPDADPGTIQRALVSPNEWLRAYGYLRVFYKFQDYEFAVRGLSALAESTNEPELRDFIQQEALNLCTDSPRTNERVARLIMLNREHNRATRIAYSGFLRCVFRLVGGETAQSLFDRQVKYRLQWRADFAKASSEEEVFEYLRLLERQTRITREYQLSGELGSYYFLKFYLLSKLNMDLAFSEILSQLRNVPGPSQFEILFFRYFDEHYGRQVRFGGDQNETDRLASAPHDVRAAKINERLNFLEKRSRENQK